MNDSQEHTNLWLATRPYLPFAEELTVWLRADGEIKAARWIGRLIWAFKKFEIPYELLVTFSEDFKIAYELYAELFTVPEIKEQSTRAPGSLIGNVMSDLMSEIYELVEYFREIDVQAKAVKETAAYKLWSKKALRCGGSRNKTFHVKLWPNTEKERPFALHIEQVRDWAESNSSHRTVEILRQLELESVNGRK